MSDARRDDSAGNAPTDGGGKLPGTFLQFSARFPGLAAAHDAMTDAALAAGPLDAKTCSLVKIGVSLGAGLESAVRSHVRRACEAGATEAEVEQAILLAMTTVGFPRTVAAWSGARAQCERDRKERSESRERPPAGGGRDRTDS